MQELSALVVPTADAIERPGKSLEDGANFESRFVQKIKKECNDLATFQGIFVATPSGMLLAGSHEDIHDPRKAEQLIRRALEKWVKLAPAQRLMTKEMLAQASAELVEVERASRYPSDGLVLTVTCRDLPRPKPSTYPHRSAYNQDYAWFRKAEARAFLPEQPSKGAKQEVPRELVERLTRFHFVDVVRGHTSPFRPKAIEKANITAEVVDVKENFVALRYQGRTRTSQEEEKWTGKGLYGPDSPRAKETDTELEKLNIPNPQTRGMDAKIEGQAIYDLKAEKFMTFELLVLAERWGGNLYNARYQSLDYGPAPMGIVLRLAGDTAVERVPPLYFRSYGWK